MNALDDAWLLLLASRSEGTPRVVIEALCRGRAVVGARAGGIPDVVQDGETGLLVDPDRAGRDRRRARRDPLRPGARGAPRRRRHARSAEWTYTAEEYAERVVELVGRAVAARAT